MTQRSREPRRARRKIKDQFGSKGKPAVVPTAAEAEIIERYRAAQAAKRREPPKPIERTSKGAVLTEEEFKKARGLRARSAVSRNRTPIFLNGKRVQREALDKQFYSLGAEGQHQFNLDAKLEVASRILNNEAIDSESLKIKAGFLDKKTHALAITCALYRDDSGTVVSISQETFEVLMQGGDFHNIADLDKQIRAMHPEDAALETQIGVSHTDTTHYTLRRQRQDGDDNGNDPTLELGELS